MKALLPVDESARLEALHRYQVLDTNPSEQAFDDLTLLIARICQTPVALVSLVDRDRQWFKSKVGLSVSQIHRNLAFCAHAILQDDVLIVPDTHLDERFATNLLVTAEPNIRFYAGAPLITPDGYRLGTLCVIDYVPRELQPDQQEALLSLSRQVINLLELQRNLIVLREREQRLRLIFEAEPECVKIIDASGKLLEMNPAGLSMIEVEDFSAVVGQRVDSLVVPEHREDFRQLNQRVCRGESGVLEFDIIGLRGTRRHLESHAVPLQIDPEGARVQLAITRDISEKKRAMEERDRFFNLSLDLICTATSEGYFTQLNPAWEKTLGYSLADLREKPFIDFVHPDDRGATTAEFQHLLNGNITPHFENRYRCQDGSYKWIAWTAVSAVEMGLVYAIGRDMTASQQVEESLRQQAEREHLVNEIAQQVRQSLDLDEILNTTVLQVQQVLQTDRVLTYRIDPNGTGRVTHEAVSPDHGSILKQSLPAETFLEEFQPHYQHGQIWAIADIEQDSMPTRLVEMLRQFGVKSKLVVPILHNSALWGLLIAHHCRSTREWRADEIELLKSLSIQVAIAIQQSQLYQQVQLELLERKRAEQKNREQAALLDVATDAIFVTDLEYQILYWNKGSERLYGWTAEAACGQFANTLLYGQTPPNAQDIYQTILLNGEWQGELQHITNDAKALTVESRWTLIYRPDGAPKAILVVNTDITQKKLLERQFLRSQRMESIGTLASGIAHDLNNILAPILMSVQLLRMRLSQDQSEQWLEILETSAKRGGELIKQVLSFARGMDGEHSIVQIRHLIDEIKKIAEETFPKSIQIYTSAPWDLWAISGDATHLHQVLMNLCVNARDAMPRGGRLSITAKNLVLDGAEAQLHLGAKPGVFVEITVADTGIGIPPHIVDRVFEPFFTTKEMNKGTGLGLSTVMGIVKSHQGFITVSSQVGTGTEFQVCLPAIDSEEWVAEDETTLWIGKGERILVVDDESPIREIAKNLLETYGYEVLTARNGAEAIALYTQHEKDIQLILIDLMMPEIDGQTTLQTLNKLNSNAKVVVSSGLLTSAELSDAERTAIHAFLPKPYTSYELLQTIYNVLRK